MKMKLPEGEEGSITKAVDEVVLVGTKERSHRFQSNPPRKEDKT